MLRSQPSFVPLVRCFLPYLPAPIYVAVLSCLPFSSDYPKAFRLDTWASKRPPFRLSVRKPTKRLEHLHAGSCQFNACAKFAGVSKCELWESSLRLLPHCGEFSVLFSSPGVVNPPQEPNKAVAHAPTDSLSQNAAYWGPAPWQRLVRPLAPSRLGTRCSHSVFGLQGSQ